MQESLLLPFIFNTVLEVLDITISQKKKKKKAYRLEEKK